MKGKGGSHYAYFDSHFKKWKLIKDLPTGQYAWREVLTAEFKPAEDVKHEQNLDMLE